MTDCYQDAVRDLFIRQIQGGRQDNFTTLLLRLIAKSDDENRDRIRRGFPQTVRAWEDWHGSANEKEFFASKGFLIRRPGGSYEQV